MNEKIKVYAQDCMSDLIKQVYKWSEEGRESVKVSITDLLLMANHIEDLELEMYGSCKISEYTLSKFTVALENNKTVEFKFNGFYYEIFQSFNNDGYMVNVYNSNEKNNGEYLEKNLIDGGLCSGTAKDAIYFML